MKASDLPFENTRGPNIQAPATSFAQKGGNVSAETRKTIIWAAVGGVSKVGAPADEPKDYSRGEGYL